MTSKPGHRTTEFWLTLAVDLAALIAAFADQLPPRYAALAGTVSTGLYALSRGWAKSTTTVAAPPAGTTVVAPPPPGQV